MRNVSENKNIPTLWATVDFLHKHTGVEVKLIHHLLVIYSEIMWSANKTDRVELMWKNVKSQQKIEQVGTTINKKNVKAVVKVSLQYQRWCFIVNSRSCCRRFTVWEIYCVSVICYCFCFYRRIRHNKEIMGFTWYLKIQKNMYSMI